MRRATRREIRVTFCWDLILGVAFVNFCHNYLFAERNSLGWEKVTQSDEYQEVKVTRNHPHFSCLLAHWVPCAIYKPVLDTSSQTLMMGEPSHTPADLLNHTLNSCFFIMCLSKRVGLIQSGYMDSITTKYTFPDSSEHF